MSTELAVRSNRTTWDVIGSDVSDCQNKLDAILEKSGLDYTVSKRPITIQGKTEPEDKYFAVVRDSDEHLYTVAKNSYTLCQNQEAFSLLNQVDSSVRILKAGETANGLIYIIAALPEVTILGDSFIPNLIFQNSHTSDYALKVATIPLRVACVNQFNVAFREANNTQVIKHTSNMTNNITRVNAIMADTAEYLGTLNEKAEKLAMIKINVPQIVDAIFHVDEALASPRAEDSRNEKIQRFLNAYQANDNGNFRGTAWGLFNAASDYLTHRPVRAGSEANYFVNSILYPEFDLIERRGEFSLVHKTATETEYFPLG